jgi:hypothetical protein
MLGEQIKEIKGKITGQRVVEVEPLTMEISVSSSRNIREIQVNEILTFVGNPAATTTSSEGQDGGGEVVIHGKGGGIIMAESEAATFTGKGIGRIVRSSGGTKWRGSLFFSTSSKGKLAFLNNMVGVFEDEFDGGKSNSQILGMEKR